MIPEQHKIAERRLNLVVTPTARVVWPGGKIVIDDKLMLFRIPPIPRRTVW
jgi:hypothetical protein